MDLPQTVPDVVDSAAERFGDAEALVDGRLRLSFDELAERVDVAARALIASGIDAGDRVAIWAPNSAEWAIAALGVFRAGGHLVTVNTRFKGPEARELLQRSGARILLTETGFLDTDYVELLGEPPACVDEVIVLRGDATSGSTPWRDVLGRADDESPSAAASRAADLSGNDVCTIMFTSGTTGRPKGALLRHGASVGVFAKWAEIVGLRADDRYLIISPFFHTFGLHAGVLACLITGATMLPHAVFDVPSVMRRVAEERITMLPGPPAIHQTMLDHPDRAAHDLSSLRLSVTGAATVPVEMISRMYGELGYETVITGYGLTESTGVVTMCRHDDDAETIANTCGRVIPGLEVRVVDDELESVPTGQPGEVVVRGPSLMAGYLDDPEATAEVFDDGWMHTGDIGVLDERGYLRITDRKKDMFIVGGFNVYPAEVEHVLTEHPHVSQAAVVGVPDRRLGEVGKAFVVPRASTAPDPDELVAWSRERMANFKVPRRFEVVDELPLNASGKVVKDELRAR